MNRIAQFEKVSFEEFWHDCVEIFDDYGLDKLGGTELGTEFNKIKVDDVRNLYDKIELPTRATKGSAGYDFKVPMDIKLKPGETITIPTGIKCKIDNGWVLMLYPRSGLGFKYRLQLDNTVGIIDSDYYGSDNEGHIMVKITNNSNEGKIFEAANGKGIVQGIFVPYGITMDDNVDNKRNGGFGSTGK